MGQLVIYHIKVEGDREATRRVDTQYDAIRAVGGDVTVSWGFGTTENILVVELPEGVEVSKFYPDLRADKFVEPISIEAPIAEVTPPIVEQQAQAPTPEIGQ